MFRLRVLGGFALEGPAGAPAFPVTQRRAEAVLAVLAVCGDLGCSRERLMALLWPESDDARSRAALRSTLHTVRQALGADAVLSAGELLRLDSRVVASDVQSFAQALGSDRQADAVRSYGGPLLDGFHLDGAPDFERWLDGERTRLAREYAEVLERLAATAERDGAWGEAANWWARAEEHDPLNSRFALQHSRALVAIGDRANALTVAERHARRLREELDLEPDREVLDEIEAIRRGDVTVPPGRGAHAVGGPAAERLRTVEGSRAQPEGHGTTPAGSRPRLLALGALGAVAVLVTIGVLASSRVKRTSSAIPLDATAIAVLPFQVVGADSASPARTLARSMGVLFELKVTGEFGRHIRHPGSVAERWRAAGGTLDSALSGEAELALARAVGAGRLVRGTIVTVGDSLVVSASMVNVATGAVRVTPVRVEGTVAQQQQLVDRLINLLLSRDAGVAPAEAPRLTRYKPEAVQAFLYAYFRSPSFSKEENAAYHAALAADSNLVDAALMAYAAGERDTSMLRYAWEHQDKLTERGRASLQVYAAGRHGSVRTMAGVIAAWETLTRRWPEWRQPWGELGEKLWFWGAAANVPDWRRRAREAFARIDPPGSWYSGIVSDLAFLDVDTAWLRAALDSQAAHGSRPDRTLASRWRLAILKGDSSEAARVLSRLPEPGRLYRFAIADGRGVAQVDRVVSSRMDGVNWRWGWARGREQMWLEGWGRLDVSASDILLAAPVYQALLLGPSRDRRVEEQVRGLERIAAGTSVPHASADDQTMARCWVALWRLRHGSTTEARSTRRYLESDAGRRQRFTGWAGLFDVLLTEAEGGDVRAALLRMDSVVREVPLPHGYMRWLPMPVEVQNLFLAQMLRRYGEPALALAAARRRMYGDAVGEMAGLPEYLREEGRLAALVGDTAGAIRAYRHYLALRENPDPPWRAPWDSVRAELAALVRR